MGRVKREEPIHGRIEADIQDADITVKPLTEKENVGGVEDLKGDSVMRGQKPMSLRRAFFLLPILWLVSPEAFSQDTWREKARQRWDERRHHSTRQTRRVSEKGLDYSLEHDGLLRTYRVHLPPHYDKNVPTPVVIYLHGGGGSIKAAYSEGVDKAADKFGFILIVPAGTGPIPDRLLVWNGGTWGSGECCGSAVQQNIDDVGFISQMIEEARAKFNVDGKRIYATGISNGGLMAYRLACELSDTIAAVAPVASPGTPSACTPSKPVSIMHIHGTADPCAPFAGGMGGGCLGTEKHEMLSAEEDIHQWLIINHCQPNRTTAYQKGNATCISYESCKDGSGVEFCTVEGMGHAWPSGSQYLPVKRIGPVSYDISFDQIWEFFKHHPMK